MIVDGGAGGLEFCSKRFHRLAAARDQHKVISVARRFAGKIGADAARCTGYQRDRGEQTRDEQCWSWRFTFSPRQQRDRDTHDQALQIRAPVRVEPANVPSGAGCRRPRADAALKLAAWPTGAALQDGR